MVNYWYWRNRKGEEHYLRSWWTSCGQAIYKVHSHVRQEYNALRAFNNFSI